MWLCLAMLCRVIIWGNILENPTRASFSLECPNKDPIWWRDVYQPYSCTILLKDFETCFKDIFKFFKESTLWADAFYKLSSQSPMSKHFRFLEYLDKK